MGTQSTAPDCLASNLKLIRMLNERSQDEAARELHMSRSNYVYIETGLHDTRPADVLMIEKVTRMNADTLLHVDIKSQLLHYLNVLSQSADDTTFVDVYVKLSARGRKRIAQYIDELSHSE